MHILYWDVFAGISGDMALASLIALGADPALITKQLQSLGLAEFSLEITSPQIRQSDSMSTCSIVFVTSADDQDQFMSVQPLQVVPKPGTKEIMDAILDSVLAKKGLLSA
ncbi:MAG: nickel insertion protein [Desulfitobacteriaceae bacterium]